MKRTYGFGIVDCKGMPWWDEVCVCKDRAPLLEIVAGLNDEVWGAEDGCVPYRVVRLFWQAKVRRK